MATTSNMFMYSLTVKPPTAITQAIVGQFSGTKEQQIITASGSWLTIHQPDPNLGRVITLVSHDIFGIIRSIASFRLTGSSKDYIILATDSGRIAIIEYLPAKKCFSRIHLETYGKSGVRRVIPGQYLAADPKGRACMIASVEKNKLVYILNRDAQAELTISSPLEAHNHCVLVFSLVALDVGYANPVFAALETNYLESDQDPSGQAYQDLDMQLVYYELDLGLNHIVRKWSEPVDRTSSLLFQVPGGSDGPSGVLVCGEENITYRHSNQEAFHVPLPRRRGVIADPQRKRTIISGVMHKLKGNAGAFFFLVQTEDGDLFKVMLDIVEDNDGNLTGEVRRIRIKYFDPIPIANSLCILKSGFLFVATELGDHYFYQFERLADNDDGSEFTSDDFPADLGTFDHHPVYFSPRPLENLALVETIDALNPLMDCKIANLTGDDAPQIYSANGGGARSTFRIMKHGLEANEIVASELPDVPSAVWTTKLTSTDAYDAYIVLSFSNETMILNIGETVTQVTDSGFLTSVETLAIQQIGDDSLVQVYPKGIRQIRNKSVNEWIPPQHRSIIAAATNERQVAVALSSGEIVYFEMDGDSLAEYDEKKEMTGTVTCLSLGRVPEGRLRSSFLAIGCDDCTVRILSLDPESTLESKSVQALTAAPSTLCIMAMEDSPSGSSALYLHIGLQSGVYLRTVLDEVTGELADTRHKFLGLQAVKIFQVTIQQQVCVLALSSRPWIGYTNPLTKAFTMTPLSYKDLKWGWNFSSDQCEEGIVGIHANHLRGPSQLIVSLQTQGSRVVVGDIQHGVTMVVYKHESSQFIPFVDDTTARWTTSMAMVDYESVAGGDKFGNIWIVRCPDRASAEADEPSSESHLSSQHYLNGAPNRLELLAHFFTQDIPTSICKTNLVVGGQDVLLWGGLQGTIGVLIPFTSREDADFFHTLESHMRSEDPPLAGRDHLIYRGYYAPVKGVIDGDLCERYLLLANDKKQAIAGELDRSVREIERKLSVSPHPSPYVYFG